MREDCTDIGKSWHKVGDVRKAFNMISPENRENYYIVKLELKVKNIELV